MAGLFNTMAAQEAAAKKAGEEEAKQEDAEAMTKVMQDAEAKKANADAMTKVVQDAVVEGIFFLMTYHVPGLRRCFNTYNPSRMRDAQPFFGKYFFFFF
jgi:ribonucleotide reductase beta subunit family protein with ferritin-like domain